MFKSTLLLTTKSGRFLLEKKAHKADLELCFENARLLDDGIVIANVYGDDWATHYEINANTGEFRRV